MSEVCGFEVNGELFGQPHSATCWLPGGHEPKPHLMTRPDGSTYEYTEPPPASKNDRAGEVMGFRRTDGMVINEPCEEGYHCPVCKYPQTFEGEYDERLSWSEYNAFLWCAVCNVDYPSALCMPDIDRAIGIFLDSVEAVVRVRTQ